MTTVHQTEQGVLWITKGAVGSLFTQLDASQRATIPDLKRCVDGLAEQGCRTLGYPRKLPETLTPATIEWGVFFIAGFGASITNGLSTMNLIGKMDYWTVKKRAEISARFFTVFFFVRQNERLGMISIRQRNDIC